MIGTGWSASASARRTSVKESGGNGRSRWETVGGLIQRMQITVHLDRGISSLMGLATQSIAIRATSTTRDAGRDKPPTIQPAGLTNPQGHIQDTRTSRLPQVRHTRATLPRLIRNPHPIDTHRIRMGNTQARSRRAPAALHLCDTTPRPIGIASTPSIRTSKGLNPTSSLRITCTSNRLRPAPGPMKKNAEALRTDPRSPKSPSNPRATGPMRTRRTTCKTGAIWRFKR